VCTWIGSKGRVILAYDKSRSELYASQGHRQATRACISGGAVHSNRTGRVVSHGDRGNQRVCGEDLEEFPG